MSQYGQKAVHSVLLDPQTVTDGATVTANLDCKNADYAIIEVLCSAEETTHAANSTLSLREADTTTLSTTTIVANKSLDLTAAKAYRYDLDCRGRKRYLQISFTAGTTTGGEVSVAASALLFRNDEAPDSTTAMVASGDVATIV